MAYGQVSTIEKSISHLERKGLEKPQKHIHYASSKTRRIMAPRSPVVEVSDPAMGVAVGPSLVLRLVPQGRGHQVQHRGQLNAVPRLQVTPASLVVDRCSSPCASGCGCARRSVDG